MGNISKNVFSMRDVCFQESGEVTLYFRGIKNDTNRDGFYTTIPPCDRSHLDPVDAFKVYTQRTENVRPSDLEPVFITLNKPYQALSAGSIADILNECIKMAGLDCSVYSAKSFRPTGAIRAI